MIDTLRYTKDLQSAGMSPEEAEIMVRNHFTMISDHVATKVDFESLKSAMKEMDLKINSKFDSKIDELSNKINGRIDKLENKIEGLENKIIVKLGALTVTVVTAITAIQSALLIFLQK